MTENRKQIVVKSKFQHTVALIITLAIFISLNFLYVIGYFLVDSISDVQQMKQVLAYAVAGVEVVAVLMIYRISIKESHRIAGPVMVLERNLIRLKEGDLSFSMRLRRNDHFHEAKEIFNDTIGELKTRIGNAQAITEKLKNESALDDSARELVEQLEKEISYFQITPPEPEDGQKAKNS